MEKTPWWKSGIFAAVLAFAIPAATAIQGWLQKERELELQERQQVQELRLAYMNVLVEAGLDGMTLVTDFAAATEQDETIRGWAERQTQEAAKAAEEEREALAAQEERVLEAEAANRAAQEEAARALAQAAEFARQAEADRQAREAAEAAARKASAAQKEAAKRSAALHAEKAKAARSAEVLSGRKVIDADRGGFGPQAQGPVSSTALGTKGVAGEPTIDPRVLQSPMVWQVLKDPSQP